MNTTAISDARLFEIEKWLLELKVQIDSLPTGRTLKISGFIVRYSYQLLTNGLFNYYSVRRVRFGCGLRRVDQEATQRIAGAGRTITSTEIGESL